MKKLGLIPLYGVCCYLAGMMIGGCTAQQKTAVKSAIDFVTVACIAEHLDDLFPQLQQACAVEEALAPDVQKFVDQLKTKRAAFAAKQCGK